MKKLIPTLIFLVLLQICYSQENTNADSSLQKLKKYKPAISGVLQVHYLEEFNTNGDSIRDPGGFRILRARITAKGKVNKNISYVVMIDPRSPEHGGLLRDAYIELHYLKNQNIRIGRQKTQFGWENRQSITELYTVNRAEMSDGAGRGENLRDNGLGLIGYIPINNNFRIEDAITFTNGTRADITGPYDFNTRKAWWGRLGVRYKKNDITINAGGSFGIGGLRYLGDDVMDPADDVYSLFNRMGADVQVDHKYFFMAVEYASGTDKVKDTLYAEPVGYQALFALKTKWKVGPLVRYDTFEDEWQVLTIGAYYGLPKDKFRILANYIFRGKVTDIPNGHDDRLYIQMQLTF